MQKLRQQILPQLEQVGLIVQEKSTDDSREMVVIPLENGMEDEDTYSVRGSGVEIEEDENEIVHPKNLPSKKELPF